MTSSSPSPLRSWTVAPLSEDVQAALERLRRLEDVAQVAVMPDVHLAEEVCVGVALATTRLLYPAAIGGDVGCGVAVLRLEGAASAVWEGTHADHILALLGRMAPIHRWPTVDAEVLAELPPLSAPVLERLRGREGRLQHGTIGRGNHFLELLADEADGLWVAVHTGSRSMGPAIQRWHRAQAVIRSGGLEAIAADSEAGQRYLADLDWARRYATSSRAVLLAAAAAVVERVLGYRAVPESLLDCDHNHVRHEPHGDRWLWVHRKGALSAGAGERAMIPGSMGSPSFLVEGRGCAAALSSSSHGAGRQLSRTAARRQIRPAQLLAQLGEVRVDRRGLGQRVEEAPSAYKDIQAVMRAQAPLTRAVQRLRPLLNHRGQ